MSGSLKGKKFLLGVSGSIAIVKAPAVVSLLRRAGAEVRVAMTADAAKMIAPVTFEAISEHPVYATMWGAETSWQMEHLDWTKWADAMIIVPASANTIAAMAAGLSSNPVTSSVLALGDKPLLIAPAMNPMMWSAPATKANVATLQARGVQIVGPVSGPTACGDVGLGRMAEPEAILDAVVGLFANIDSKLKKLPAPKLPPINEEEAAAELSSSLLDGRHITITAGPTREKIDAVRFLTNPSSGKMGFAIAEEAARRGARVDLVHGPVYIPDPTDPKITQHPVTTALEMHAATMKFAEHSDVAVFSAAVADYRPAEQSNRKTKKTGESRSLKLTPNPDIANDVGELDRPGQIRVGFAAETDNIEVEALKKLERKNLHLIVANDVSQTDRGFGTDENAVTIFGRGEVPPEKTSLLPKAEVAARILDRVEKLLLDA